MKFLVVERGDIRYRTGRQNKIIDAVYGQYVLFPWPWIYRMSLFLLFPCNTDFDKAVSLMSERIKKLIVATLGKMNDYVCWFVLFSFSIDYVLSFLSVTNSLIIERVNYFDVLFFILRCRIAHH